MASIRVTHTSATTARVQWDEFGETNQSDYSLQVWQGSTLLFSTTTETREADATGLNTGILTYKVIRGAEYIIFDDEKP